MKKLRVLLNIPRYDYGKKELGNSFEFDTFYKYFIDAGHNVNIFDYTTIINDFGANTLHNRLIKEIKHTKYDLIFTVPFTNEFKFDTLDALKKENSGALSLAWMCDDKWRWENYSKNFIGHFDYIITTDENSVAKYVSNGFSNVILSQWAHNPSVYKKSKGNKRYDVTFVGGTSAWREHVINYLEKKGIVVNCFGAGWKNGRRSVEEIVKIYNQSKIVLNISNSTQLNLPFLLTFKKWPHDMNLKQAIAHSFPGLVDFFLSEKRKEDIKARFFEVTATKSFLLSYPVEHLNYFFKLGKEVAIYRNLDELQKMIKFYLRREYTRELIAEAGYRKTSTMHTYKKRFDEIFNIIGIA